jgi:homoserine dehydrogenase
MSEKKLTVGLIGVGTVGRSTLGLLQKRRDELRSRHALTFHVKRIAEKDPRKRKGLKAFGAVVSQDVHALLNDPEIDTVVELIGGEHPAYEIILEALRKKKNVVTGNKQLIATLGEKLFKEARKNNCYLGFRASITGCHQVKNHLEYGGTIKSILGVYNGTTNYILSRMEEADVSLSDALKEAQDLGFAERNASLDIDGSDSAHKMIVVTRLAFAHELKKADFHIEGIEGIKREDVRYAKELGYGVRLLGTIRRDGNSLEVRLHPCLVGKDKQLAHLKGVQNGIEITDEARGNNSLVALGAGGDPAGSAVLADLIDIANDTVLQLPATRKQFRVKKMSQVKCEYYLRFNAVNKPGVLAKIATVLARHGINIRTVIQKGPGPRAVTPIIVITDRALERETQKAVRAIDQLPITRGKTELIRLAEGAF